MNLYLIKMFVVSLMLTWIIELLVFRLVTHSLNPREVRLVVLVNLLTNPAAVWFAWAAGMVFYPTIPRLMEIFAEAAVIAAEAAVYQRFSKTESWHIKKPVLTAVTANVASWGFGLILQRI